MKLLRHRAKVPPWRLEAKFTLSAGTEWPVTGTRIPFRSERKWRADFAHVESRTRIEIEGGIHIAGGGRHNRAGFITDLEKYLTATLDGWRVLRLAEPFITAQMVELLISFVRTAGVKSV